MSDQEVAVWYNDNVIYPDKVRLNCYYYHHYSFIKDSLHGAWQTNDVQLGNNLKEERGDYLFENLAGSQIIRIFAK